MRWPTLAAGLGLLVTSVASAANLTRGPFLQSVDADSAVVGLRLDTACPAQVRLGTEGGQTFTASSPGSATEHFIPLEGLQPGTRYQYTVDACGAPTNRGGILRTAPPPGTRRVHFAAMGDFGTGGPAQIANGAAILEKAPEFWLALGDTAYESGTDQEFQQRFFSPLEPLLASVPVFASIGNHEYVTSNGAPFFAAFELPRNNPASSERYYSFDWGPVHVVALDAMCELGTSSEGCTAADQKQWLQQDLAASRAPWKIVMFHHPVYSSGDHRSTEQLHDWVPLFEAGGVDLVLTGHDHNYERTRPMKGVYQVAPEGTPGAVTYLVVGNGAATLRSWAMAQPEWSAVRNNQDYGFLDLVIDGGKLTATALTPAGKVIDQFRLTKDVPGGGSGPSGLDGSTADGGTDGPPGIGCGHTGSWFSPLAAGWAALGLTFSRRRRAHIR